MSAEEDFKVAQQRIAEAKRSGAVFLNLGDLELAAIPREIEALGHYLKYLSLGLFDYKVSDEGDIEREYQGYTHYFKKNITDLGPLATLTALQELDLNNFEGLTDLSPLETLTTLESLNLSECGSLSDLNPLATLNALQWLDLSGCDSLTDLRPLATLTALQLLDLRECRSLTNLNGLETLTALQSLDLSRCDSLTDLRPLAILTALQSLSLSGCGSLTDLRPLATLTALQSLDLNFCESLTDLRPLVTLTALQSLKLSGYKLLTDLSALATLTTLHSLDLIQCDMLTDFSALAPLTALQSLSLSGCESLTDLRPLAPLTALQSLSLSGCESLTDLRPLATLTALQSLSLIECKSLTDLSPLAALTALQSLGLTECKSLTDLSPLATLTALQSLSLSECQSLTDLSPLGSLTAMKKLSLSRCETLADLSPLAALPALKLLDLSSCKSISIFKPVLSLLGHLHDLRLYDCGLIDLPKEMFGSNEYENVIDKVRAHYADLAYDGKQNSELKLFILGNGGVGKTQLSRRLSGQGYDPKVESTHGIQQTSITIDAYEPEQNETIQLNLWDFGGQDIYHGSHTLFIHGHALFIVIWVPEKESGSYADGGTTIYHRPLSYWLDYIRNLTGPDITLLLVQGHCDKPSQRQPPAISVDDFRYCRVLSISPKTGFGLETLRGELKDAVQAELEQRPAIAIGQGRVEVREQLRKMLREDQALVPSERQHRTLSRAGFNHLCAENGKISNADAFLDYLHHCGDLFYRQGLFNDQIILDQAWALDAIYSLFHREYTLPVLNRHGRFTREELALLIWRDYSPAEQKLFLSFMESCDICFKVKRPKVGIDDSEWEFIAPELLPEEAEMQAWLTGRMIGAQREKILVSYRFLHEGILRSLLSRIGHWASDNAIYWKYGCWFYEDEAQSQILIQSQVETESGQGQICLTAVGEKPRQLIVKVLGLLNQIRVGQAPQITGSWFDKPITLNENQQMSESSDTRPHPNQETSTKLHVSKHPELDAAGQPEIYISYAWGDDHSDMGRQRETAVAGIASVAEECGFTVRQDRRDTRTGDWISNYMKAISNADRVIVILSAKYLQSELCMTELHGIYKRAGGEKKTFLDRICVVVLDDARAIRKIESRIEFAKHWKQRYQALEPDLDVIGNDGYRLWQQMGHWYRDVADMLGFVADTIHPHGFDDLIRDNYAGMRELLYRKKKDS